MKKSSHYILGINISHDAAAVPINGDGEVLAGNSEERLTGQQYHETFPFQATWRLLQYISIKGRKITEAAYNWRNMCHGGGAYGASMLALTRNREQPLPP